MFHFVLTLSLTASIEVMAFLMLAYALNDLENLA